MAQTDRRIAALIYVPLPYSRDAQQVLKVIWQEVAAQPVGGGKIPSSSLSKVAIPVMVGAPSNTWSLWALRVNTPNWITIGSAHLTLSACGVTFADG